MATMATLSWSEWIAALFRIVCDTLFQRFFARHVPPRVSLPNLAHLTVMVTGATSGIGLHTAK